ncbi:MAG: ABC transporter substrate-binding protein [Candidatus Nanopelagicales bacterium]
MSSYFRAGRVAVAVLAGALALSACGGDSTTSDTSPSAATSVTVDDALAAKVPESVKSTGKLTFGTDASYAPSEFFAEDGTTIVGFDVDLGKAIATKLGLEGVFENASFDALIVGVTNGKWPASMSSFTINPDRLKQVNMISYFDAGTAWAVQSGNPSGISIDNACGKTVAVQKATVQVPDIQDRDKTCKQDGNPGINIQQYGLQSEATTAVVSGKADAMLADSPVTAYAIQQASQLEQLGDVYGTAPYGIVVPKDETEFADAIQGAVQSLIDDGTYMQILDQWGVGNGAIPTSEVNPAVG